MNYPRLWVSAVIIALVIIVGFILSVPHTRDVPRPLASEEIVLPVPSVSLHDVFKKGTHTITGSLMAPNACATVTASSTLENGNILVSFVLSTDTNVCLQVPTLVKVTTSIVAPADMPFSATVNGSIASTTAS